MKTYLSRKEYAELCPDDARPEQYPKTTERAALELQQRGFRVYVGLLAYLIKKGEITRPPGRHQGGRTLGWREEDVNHAAAILARRQDDVCHENVALADFCRLAGADLPQVLRALREQRFLYPGIARELFTMTAVPYADNDGLRCRVSFDLPKLTKRLSAIQRSNKGKPTCALDVE